MTNAEAWFNNSLCPRKPEGSLGRTAQDGHLDSHTAPELWSFSFRHLSYIASEKRPTVTTSSTIMIIIMRIVTLLFPYKQDISRRGGRKTTEHKDLHTRRRKTKQRENTFFSFTFHALLWPWNQISVNKTDMNEWCLFVVTDIQNLKYMEFL